MWGGGYFNVPGTPAQGVVEVKFMSCTLRKKPDFSEPLISSYGLGTRETQHVAV